MPVLPPLPAAGLVALDMKEEVVEPEEEEVEPLQLVDPNDISPVAPSLPTETKVLPTPPLPPVLPVLTVSHHAVLNPSDETQQSSEDKVEELLDLLGIDAVNYQEEDAEVEADLYALVDASEEALLEAGAYCFVCYLSSYSIFIYSCI